MFATPTTPIADLKFNTALHSVAPSGDRIHAENGYIEVPISLYICEGYRKVAHAEFDNYSVPINVSSRVIGIAFRAGKGKWQFEFSRAVSASIEKATKKEWAQHLEDEGEAYDEIAEISRRSSEYDQRIELAHGGF